MSWADYTDRKGFGRIARPYSDMIASFVQNCENRIGRDPAFAKYVGPISQRDTILISGDSLHMLVISKTCARQYPMHLHENWGDVLGLKESNFIHKYPESETVPLLFEDKNLYYDLYKSLHIEDPIIFTVPRLSQSFLVNQFDKQQQDIVDEVGCMILEKERERYMEEMERNKPREIFLSHKSSDKYLVREVAKTLREIGLSAWIDEDKMVAGTKLERGIKCGFEDSCAAVFFITENFADQGYLETEIDYAIQEKRSKGDRFQIITLRLPKPDGTYPEVPSLLSPYVYKDVSHITIIRTILEALPIGPVKVDWKESQ